MYTRMSEEEIRPFLSSGTKTGKLATVRPDGSPHVAPIWFVLDEDGTVVFNTGRETVKGRALRRDPRVSMCVDDENPPFAYVRVDGTASLSEDLDEMLPWSTRIAARYMGDDKAEAYGRRNAVDGEMLVRVKPTKIVALKAIAD
jgi:PPOX class probable F420-dependent enzyme